MRERDRDKESLKKEREKRERRGELDTNLANHHGPYLRSRGMPRGAHRPGVVFHDRARVGGRGSRNHPGTKAGSCDVRLHRVQPGVPARHNNRPQCFANDGEECLSPFIGRLTFEMTEGHVVDPPTARVCLHACMHPHRGLGLDEEGVSAFCVPWSAARELEHTQAIPVLTRSAPGPKL